MSWEHQRLYLGVTFCRWFADCSRSSTGQSTEKPLIKGRWKQREFSNRSNDSGLRANTLPSDKLTYLIISMEKCT
jgi:hypothetical protein